MLIRQSTDRARSAVLRCQRASSSSSDNLLKQRRLLHAVVPDRRILAVAGRDAEKLVQNLTTNDLGKKNDVQFTAFLTPQGRTIGTAFLFRPNSETIWIDVDAGAADSVLQSIKRFKLRSKVTLTDQSDALAVLAHWNGDEASSEALCRGQDHRTPTMGFRSIVDSSSTSARLLEGSDASKTYTVHRMLNGVADTASETEGGMPLEANVDLMGGVDFRKGCYVGQELTARTHHTGIVRKRVVPVVLSSEPSQGTSAGQYVAGQSFDHVGAGADIRALWMQKDESKPSRSRSAGKLLSFVDNVGLTMLRLEWIDKVKKGECALYVQASDDESTKVYLHPWVPEWWPNDVQQQET